MLSLNPANALVDVLNRRREDQRIKSRLVETCSNQLDSRDDDARLLRNIPVYLFGFTEHHPDSELTAQQFLPDHSKERLRVILSLGQDQNIAT